MEKGSSIELTKEQANEKGLAMMAGLSQFPIQKAIVEILAVQVYEIRQIDLINCMNGLEYRDEKNKPFSYKSINPFIEDLKQKGFIIQNKKGFACRNDVWLEVIVCLVAQGRYKMIAAQVLQSIPLLKPILEKFYGFTETREFFRAILIAVFSDGEFANPDLVYLSGAGIKKFKKNETPPLLDLFNHPFRPGLMDMIKLPLRWKVLGYILEEGAKKSIPVQAAGAYGISLLSEFYGYDKDFRVLDHYFLSGRMDLYKKLLSGFSDLKIQHLVQMGKAAMAGNNNETALIFFKKALAALEEEKSEGKWILNGYDGLFCLVSLLGSEAVEDLHTGIRFIHHLMDYPDIQDSPVVSVAGSMLPLFSEQGGGETVQSHVPEYFIFKDDSIVTFFSILVLSWTQAGRARLQRKVLEEIREKTMACGYDWLTAEICSLLAYLGIDTEINTARAEALHDTMGTTSIVHLYEPVFAWRNALQSIIRMGEPTGNHGDQSAGPGAEQRLVWQLEHNDTSGACHILPYIQKLTQKGRWTRGKSILISDLLSTYLGQDWLTPQDNKVCAAIEKEKNYRNSRYFHGAEFCFDMEKALPALVGHPLVFFENNFNTPMELVKGEPEIRISTRNGKHHINMEPLPGNKASGVTLVKETPFLFKVVEFTIEQISIARLLGQRGLVIPAREEKKMEQAIASVSSFFTVHSDLGTEDTEAFVTLEADPKVYVQLTPFKTGVKMELLVNPLGETGSCFRPGHGGRHIFAEIGGKKARVVRDLGLEKTNGKKIIDACPTLESLASEDGEWIVDDPEQALELLLELKDCWEKPILKWPRGQKMQVRSRVGLSDFDLTLKKDREWFKATGKLLVDEDVTVELSRFMSLLESSSGGFVTLDDGTFLAITKSLKARMEELKAYSMTHGEELMFSPLAAPAMEGFMEQVGSLKSDWAWKAHCRRLKETIQPKIPPTLKATLRDYQITGFNWLCQLAHWQVGGCLADDMGLGKTVQSLAAILVHAAKGPALVVAPLSVMNNWKEECLNFTPDLNPLVFGGTDRQEFLDGIGPFDLVICSYGLLQKEGEKLSGVEWQTIVLDEAQAIKNRKTKRSRAAMKLKADFRLITTGTPVENRLDELWTLFQFLNPGLLGTYQHFRRMFILPIEGNQDKAASKRLRKLIRPFLLRRRKTDVLKELPEKTEITLQVEMSREEAILYEAQRLTSLQNIEQSEDAPGQKHFRILAELTRLRQLCCNPSLVLPDTPIESSKLRVFLDTVRELLENGHKALVFSQFVGHLNILQKALDKERITYQYLDGSTPADKRRERIKDFQSGHGDLFLISLKAGGTGLNLTAADYVIHMDPWWNPAVEDQASDRAHRIGQTRPVTVYRLVVKASIEEYIVDLHKEKRDLAESLLAGSEAAGKLSAADLLALMQGKKAGL